MNFKKLLLIVVLLLTFSLVGCGSSDEPGNYYGDEYYEENTDPEPPAPVIDDAELDGGEVIQSGDIPALLDRKIIYTASLSMTSPEPETIYNDLVSSLTTYEAYIESANITSTRYIVKIRVLSVNFTDFIEDIKESGDIVSYTKTSEDVTNSYSTFEARKLALETQHARLLELLEVAVDLSDIITLNNALADIESDLNQIGDTLANYDSLVDYSTINLTINKTTEQEVILPQTTSPSVNVVNYTKKTAELEVANNSDYPVLIYVDVMQNGEFIRQYDGEAFPDGVATFEISDLKSDTDYMFRVTSIAADQRESKSINRSIETESTFFNKVGNVFVGSFSALVFILEFLGLAFVAIVPFAVAFAIVFIPSRILYNKYGKQYFKTRKENKQKLINKRQREKVKREE